MQRTVNFAASAALCAVYVLIGRAYAAPLAGDLTDHGNRLTSLNGIDPYYVGRDFARFTTPQWCGEPDVEAVVVLGIDDMRGHEKWEAYLRPILERLKQIDGRAALSIMTNQIDAAHTHLQTWLREGVSLECHTFDHPCPLLREGDFSKAKATYDRSVDLMNQTPNSRAIAFRMPCCDSLNTVSPRFFAEIFNRKTPQNSFLSIDSSVFLVTTPNDPALPRELVFDADGRERFRKYLPFPSFVNTIADYPYPYVIGGVCWEFPCIVPSDWEAQNIQKPNNPRTLADMQAALDAVVIKQGVYNLCFHPHGWIRNDQIVAFIDHAVARHGKKVKFLNFREAAERLQSHALGGQTLRAADGGDNGVRLLDLNGDGFQDVVIANEQVRQTRLWSPAERRWLVGEFPRSLVSVDKEGIRRSSHAQFGIVDEVVSLVVRDEAGAGSWQFRDGHWVEQSKLLAGLELDGQPIATAEQGRDRGVRFHDLDADGTCELLVSNPQQNAVFRWGDGWQKLSWCIPADSHFVNAEGRDDGLRLVDIDENLRDDVIYSNEREQGFFLFSSIESGWNEKVFAEARRESERLPMFSRQGSDNGAWFHSRNLWVQNEDTARLPDLVDRRAFNDLLADMTPAPKSPAAALASLKPRPGFQVELIAAEPLVEDPIAFDWGIDGKFWVVEMGDYPNGIDSKHSPGGRIRLLEDSDGDGRYDRSQVFLDGLRYPTSVLSWRKGVLVTAAPDLFYAEDTDGDGKADTRKVLFTGFGKGNPQHVVNGLGLGLDNWVYGANGDSGGNVKSFVEGPAVSIGGRDFRCRPDDGRFQPQAGYTQYVRSQDDWGNWFGSSNNNPMWQYVLEDHYLRRNPYFTPPDGRWNLSDVPGQSPVYPLSRMLERFNDPHTANCFTSACSAMLYRDELFGPLFAGNAFISEPVHNLVHREVVVPDGVKVRSHRAIDELRSEFLASTDSYFRPTMLRTGPDGALWIADMYRLVIEHPEWIPAEMRKRWDLRAGSDQGRIYRVYPVGAELRPIPRLDRLSPVELVAQLESPNGWVRDKVQQLLVAGKDPGAKIPLVNLAEKGIRPTARLHAICALDGMGLVDSDLVKTAVRDPHPGVRRHAIRIAETLKTSAPQTAESLASLVDDSDPAVRLQLAYSLGEFSDPAAGRALGKLALQDADNMYIAAAVMSSVVPHLREVSQSVVAAAHDQAPNAQLVANLVSVAAAIPHTEAMLALIPMIAAGKQGAFDTWQFEAVAELLDTLDRRQATLAEFREKSPEALRPEIDNLTGLFGAARALAVKRDAKAADRALAVRLLGRGADHAEDDLRLLAALLAPTEPAEVRRAALVELGRLQSDQVPHILLGQWDQIGPATQPAVLDVLFSREAWLASCLDALAAAKLLPAAVDATHRQQLLDHRSKAVRERAATLFAVGNSADRQRIFDEYRAAAATPGDAERGAQVFGKRCAVCHRVGETGHAVGPDLAALTDRSTEALLIALLDPNRAVEAKYVNYTAATTAGLTYTGLVAAETATSVTLVGQEAKQQVVLRSDLESLASSGKSLMPEGFDKDITPAEMADVITYVQKIGRRPKTLPGNAPQIVTPEPLRRQIFCQPSNCEIYGTTLRLEEVNSALGYWNSADDQAVWTIEIPKAMRYAVLLDVACPASAAGNTWLVEIDDYRLTGKVEPTASWNTYQRQKAGEVRLEAGKHRLGVRAQGAIRDALFDLKGVVLIPLPGG